MHWSGVLVYYYKSEFGGMKGNLELKMHAITFSILLVVIFFCTVSRFPLIIAFIIMGFNVYKITNFFSEAKFNNSRNRNKQKIQKSK